MADTNSCLSHQVIGRKHCGCPLLNEPCWHDGDFPKIDLEAVQKEAERVKDMPLADEQPTVATFEEPTNETRLRRFARDLLEKALEGYNFDGADVQEYGLQHGLLKEVTANEPCGDSCVCAEVTDFPTNCFRFTDVMKPETYA